jgi:hypothetical protein
MLRGKSFVTRCAQVLKVRRWVTTSTAAPSDRQTAKFVKPAAAFVVVAVAGIATAHYVFDVHYPWDPKGRLLGTVIEECWESTAFVGHTTEDVEQFSPGGVVVKDHHNHAVIIGDPLAKHQAVRLRLGNKPYIGTVIAHDKPSKISLVRLPPAANDCIAASYTLGGVPKAGDYVFCAPNLTSATANMGTVADSETEPVCEGGADACRLHYFKLRGMSFHGGPVFSLNGACLGLQVPHNTDATPHAEVCYVLSAADVQYVANELLLRGHVRRPYMGMVIGDYPLKTGGHEAASSNDDGAAASAASDEEHVVVDEVEPGSPADAAGMKRYSSHLGVSLRLTVMTIRFL